MPATGIHRRPGRFKLIWIRVVRMFSKERGEFMLFAFIDQVELSCREQYDKIRGLIQGQEELRGCVRELEGVLLARDLEILDLKAALGRAEAANETNRIRHTVLAPADLLVHKAYELPEYAEPEELDEKTLQDILIKDITRAIVPVQTRGVLQIVPLGQAPVARTSPNLLDEESSGASV